MRFLGALVLLLAIVTNQGHPLSEARDETALPSSSNEPEKEKPDLNAKPEPAENSNAELKPETPVPDLKPESPVSDLKPQSDTDSEPAAAAIPVMQNPCSSIEKDCTIKPADTDLERRNNEYDQRQNGTENYRIQVDGLVFVVAPVEALLLAGGAAAGADPDLLGGKPNITSLLNATGLKSNNEHYSESSQFSPGFYSAPKPSEGPVSIKLINLIAPLLEQRRHFGR